MADFIDVQRTQYSDLSDKYGILGDLYAKKLYHQLALALLEFTSDPRSNRGDNLIQLWDKFISTFDGKLNQLQLVVILSQIAVQYFPSRPYSVVEVDRALAFLSGFKDKKARLGDDAFLALNMEITSLKLKKAQGLASAGSAAATEAVSGLLDECKRELAEGKDALDALPNGEDPIVPATYHRTAAEYFKLRGPAHSFYEHALLFLGNTPLERLSPEARHALAVDVALAALVGDGVYNFGEVNAHPILGALAGSPQAWLVDLLASFQTGDIDAFNGVVGAHRAAYDAQPALVAAAGAIKEKLTLLAVMELASRRPADNRSIPFGEIAAHTRLAPEQVEWVAMRALALGLVAGKIDEVDQVFNIAFVKPRVLDAAQTAALKDRVDAWRAKASEALLFMEDHTRELLA